ncbi:hypothetical protein RNT97_12620, partial [Staphylococcus pseudintermedius]
GSGAVAAPLLAAAGLGVCSERPRRDLVVVLGIGGALFLLLPLLDWVLMGRALHTPSAQAASSGAANAPITQSMRAGTSTGSVRAASMTVASASIPPPQAPTLKPATQRRPRGRTRWLKRFSNHSRLPVAISTQVAIASRK